MEHVRKCWKGIELSTVTLEMFYMCMLSILMHFECPVIFSEFLSFARVCLLQDNKWTSIHEALNTTLLMVTTGIVPRRALNTIGTTSYVCLEYGNLCRKQINTCIVSISFCFVDLCDC